MVWIFAATYFSWFFSEVFLSLSRRSKTSEKQNADKGSLGLIWTIIIVANFVAFYVAALFPMPIAESANIKYVGLAIIVVGVILRYSIVSSLGKYFTVNVSIAEDHKLKTDGFYKYLRHPSYSASLLSFAGYGISLNNWISLVLIVVAVSTAFLIRIRIEEEVLMGYFGEAYQDYKRKTKRLIPLIY